MLPSSYVCGSVLESKTFILTKTVPCSCIVIIKRRANVFTVKIEIPVLCPVVSMSWKPDTLLQNNIFSLLLRGPPEKQPLIKALCFHLRSPTLQFAMTELTPAVMEQHFNVIHTIFFTLRSLLENTILEINLQINLSSLFQ